MFEWPRKVRANRTGFRESIGDVELLAIRIGLPALAMLAVTAVQHRFGHRLGGRLVGLPLTTGPFLLVLELTSGRAAAARAAHGSVAGQLGVVAFCAGYAVLARRGYRVAVVLGGALSITAVTDLVAIGIGNFWVTLALVLGAATTVLWCWPTRADTRGPTTSPAWEAPVKVLATITVVATLTAAAPLVGARLAGVLACLPVLLSILTPPTQRRCGRAAAASLLRGTVSSLPATVIFIAVLAIALPSGAALAWAGATVALIAVNALAERPVRRLVTAHELTGGGSHRTVGP